MVDEIEAAGCLPLLTHAAKAKLMMGHVDKTDKLDARGLAILLHNGTLPSVWLPPAAVRDERELTRTRMALVRIRTNLKNRAHATLAKFGVIPLAGDLFSLKGRAWLGHAIRRLRPETRRSLELELELLDQLQIQIDTLETRILDRIQSTPSIQLLKTLPGVGNILAIVIACEVGLAFSLPFPQPLRLLCRHRPQGQLQWRQDPLWPHAPGGQPLPQMRLCRGRQRRGPSPRQRHLGLPPRERAGSMIFRMHLGMIRFHPASQG